MLGTFGLPDCILKGIVLTIRCIPELGIGRILPAFYRTEFTRIVSTGALNNTIIKARNQIRSVITQGIVNFSPIAQNTFVIGIEFNGIINEQEITHGPYGVMVKILSFKIYPHPGAAGFLPTSTANQ